MELAGQLSEIRVPTEALRSLESSHCSVRHAIEVGMSFILDSGGNDDWKVSVPRHPDGLQ